MDIADIERMNAATLRKIRETPNAIDAAQDRYFGFYTVDIFECPPFVMFTANDCPRAHDILYGRFFEQMSMKIWCRLARSASDIFDIGAQVGVYSLAAASLRSDIPIQAFEPNPYAYTRLRMHKAVNGFSNIVENRIALAHKACYAAFSWAIKPGQPISSGGRLSPGMPGVTETIVAETCRLDDLQIAAQLGNRGLMKVDVEGGEINTFAGMSKTLTNKPDIILETFSQKSCDIINSMILPLGYQTYLVCEHERDLVPQDRLLPCTPVGDGNFNQFLTTRADAEIRQLLK